MKKFDLEQIFGAFRKQYEAAEESEDLTSIINFIDFEELEDMKGRGFKFGTSWESWDALYELADALAAGEEPPPAVVLWFVAAVSGIKKKDPRDLMRQLGLIEMGPPRIVNKYDLCKRMIELVDTEGLIKAEASRRCAEEFGCSRSTALHWYSKRDEVLNN